MGYQEARGRMSAVPSLLPTPATLPHLHVHTRSQMYRGFVVYLNMQAGAST